MSRSARRLFVTVATIVLASIVAGCAGGPAAPGVGGTAAPIPNVDPTQPYGPYPTLPPTGGQPPTGNTGQQFPELSVSLAEGYVIDLVDPTARAWWVVVSGTGPYARDRLEIVAEVGDIWPGAAVHLYVDGKLVDTTDMNGLLDNSTAIAGGCHPTLDLCFSSAGIEIRPDDGALSVVLERSQPGRFEVRAATAAWDGEPYILGPWRGTETITTG